MTAKRAMYGLGLALAFGIGCGAGAGTSAFIVPPARAGTNPQRWEYHCMEAGSGITPAANQRGAQGWKMVSGAAYGYAGSSLGGTSKMVWCFKRPL